MSIVKKLYLSRKTIIEMLKDRYFLCENQAINIMPFSQFNDLYESSSDIFNNYSGILDIYSSYIGKEHKLQNTKTIVKFVMSIDNKNSREPIVGSAKKAINEINNILIPMTNKQYDLKKNDTIILIICYGENLHEAHLQIENYLDNIQIFHLNRLIFNISKHNLIPKHIKMNINEVNELKKKFMLDTVEKLPHILNTDPMAKYLNLKCGDVCKIIRPSKNAGEHICYRYCEQNEEFLVNDFNIKYEKSEKSEKSKKIIIKDEPKMGDIKNATITLTFAEQVENEKGNQTIGEKAKLGEGINFDDLKFAEAYFKKNGFQTELYNLRENLPNNELIENYKFGDWEHADKPYILVIRNGAKLLIGENNIDKMFEEQAELPHDHQSFQKGRVVTQHTRWNLCFADINQKADYELKKGTVIKFGDDIPLTTQFRNNLENIFDNDKAKNLYAEGNYYFDKTKCGIRFHGDYERRKVIAVRLGATIPIVYQWHYGPDQKALGKPISIDINHGDIYIMSEKAVGTDWKQQKIYTLRHAAGCPEQVAVNPKYLELDSDDKKFDTDSDFFF